MMNKIMVAVLLAMALTGCASSGGVSGTGAAIVKAENHETRVIRWVRISNFSTICKDAGHTNSGACASTDENVCTIYAPEPTGVDDVTRIHLFGHEALHCFYGKYHAQ
jgi:outer membrane lipoprotein SlyB